MRVARAVSWFQRAGLIVSSALLQFGFVRSSSPPEVLLPCDGFTFMFFVSSMNSFFFDCIDFFDGSLSVVLFRGCFSSLVSLIGCVSEFEVPNAS